MIAKRSIHKPAMIKQHQESKAKRHQDDITTGRRKKKKAHNNADQYSLHPVKQSINDTSSESSVPAAPNVPQPLSICQQLLQQTKSKMESMLQELQLCVDSHSEILEQFHGLDTMFETLQREQQPTTTCPTPTDTLLKLNFGGKCITIDRCILENPNISRNLFTALFEPCWERVLPRDRNGYIYLELEYSWVKPILDAYEDAFYCSSVMNGTCGGGSSSAGVIDAMLSNLIDLENNDDSDSDSDSDNDNDSSFWRSDSDSSSHSDRFTLLAATKQMEANDVNNHKTTCNIEVDVEYSNSSGSSPLDVDVSYTNANPYLSYLLSLLAINPVIQGLQPIFQLQDTTSTVIGEDESLIEIHSLLRNMIVNESYLQSKNPLLIASSHTETATTLSDLNTMLDQQPVLCLQRIEIRRNNQENSTNRKEKKKQKKDKDKEKETEESTAVIEEIRWLGIWCCPSKFMAGEPFLPETTVSNTNDRFYYRCFVLSYKPSNNSSSNSSPNSVSCIYKSNIFRGKRQCIYTPHSTTSITQINIGSLQFHPDAIVILKGSTPGLSYKKDSNCYFRIHSPYCESSLTCIHPTLDDVSWADWKGHLCKGIVTDMIPQSSSSLFHVQLLPIFPLRKQLDTSITPSISSSGNNVEGHSMDSTMELAWASLYNDVNELRTVVDHKLIETALVQTILDRKCLHCLSFDKYFSSIPAAQCNSNDMPTVVNINLASIREKLGCLTNSLQQIALSANLAKQQTMKDEIVWFNVRGETVCLLKCTIQEIIPNSQLATRLNNDWIEQSSTVDDQGRIIMNFHSKVFLPFVEYLRARKVFGLCSKTISYPNQQLHQLAQEMLDYFVIDDITLVTG